MKQEYREWYEEHPPVFTNEIQKLRTMGDQLVVCLSKGEDIAGDLMWGVNIRKKHEGGFKAVDHDLNRPFHDKEEAEEYFFRLETMADDWARLAEYID
jgi:hypothetical protein